MKLRSFILILLVTFNSALVFSQGKPLSADTLKLIQKLQEDFERERAYPSRAREATDRLNRIAEIYFTAKHYEQALKYYNQSLEINKTILNSQHAIAKIHTQIGNIYYDKGNYDEALKHQIVNLEYERTRKNARELVDAVTQVALLYNKLKKYDETIQLIENEALPIAHKTNDQSLLRSCYGTLAETYEKQGNSEKQRYYYDLYNTFMVAEVNNSRSQIERERMQREQAELLKRLKELELEQTEDSLLKSQKQVVELNEREAELMETLTKKEMSMRIIEQENNIKELENAKISEENKRQRNALILISLLAIVIAMSAVFLLKLLRDKKRANLLLTNKNIEINRQKEEIYQQKEEIQASRDGLTEMNKILTHKNKLITDSLTYAKMIQDAMINRRMQLDNWFAESFIIFNPRDIVSGDFYWYEQIDNKTIVIAADCTGHGVPGAFLTFIGNSLLNQVIIHEGITDPATILTRIDKGVAEALNQEHSDNTDGMDISICVYDKNTKQLDFGGAKNSLLMVAGGNVEEVLADKSSIGGFEIKRRNMQKGFNTKTIEVEPGTWFYIFSDGIVDQFDRRSKRKYSKNRFQTLLTNIQHLPSEIQKIEILKDMDAWRGSDKQTDDIIVIGFCPLPA